MPTEIIPFPAPKQFDIAKVPEIHTEPFFLIQNKIFDGGVFTLLSGNALLLFLLLLRRSYNRKGYIYTNQIIDFTNITRAHVSQYVKELEKYQLISKTGQSKKYAYFTYRITAGQDTNIKET